MLDKAFRILGRVLLKIETNAKIQYATVKWNFFDQKLK